MVNETLVALDATWRDTALCLSYPALMFFGLDDLESPAERRAREDQAKVVCAACPVRRECLDYALSMREPYGIWGGLTEIERKAHLRQNGRNGSGKL